MAKTCKQRRSPHSGEFVSADPTSNSGDWAIASPPFDVPQIREKRQRAVSMLAWVDLRGIKRPIKSRIAPSTGTSFWSRLDVSKAAELRHVLEKERVLSGDVAWSCRGKSKIWPSVPTSPGDPLPMLTQPASKGGIRADKVIDRVLRPSGFWRSLRVWLAPAHAKGRPLTLLSPKMKQRAYRKQGIGWLFDE